MTLPLTAANYDELMSQRESITDIDVAISALLIRRRQHSIAAQAAKQTMGLPRVDLAQENLVREHYRLALGDTGNRVADAILYHSKH